MLIAAASLRYALTGVTGAPSNVAQNRFAASGALLVHIAAATVALAIGPLQFFPALRARWPAWHRRIGTAYVIACLVGGVAGGVLAAGASEGPIATAGFGLLAISWIGATAMAWRYAKARDFVRHQQWMTRSFALTFAAVTLRLYLPVLFIAHLDFEAGYRAISFLCWAPNLVVAELWLRRRSLVRTSPRRAAPARSRG
jgi:uncharacterized membrane protein